MKKLFFIILIIFFLSIFSSRYVNYDDYLYFFSSKVLQSKNIFEFSKTEFIFNGLKLTPLDGTHTFLPYFLFHLINKIFRENILILHLFNYSVAVLIFLLLSFYFKKLGIEKSNILSFLFTLTPAFALYYNSFMLDGLFFLSFLASYISFKNFLKNQDLKNFLIFFLLLSISIFLSYINLFLILIYLFYFKKIDKKFNLFFLLFLLFILIVLNISIFGADILKSLRWQGSEKFLNYHKIFKKIIEYIIWFGLLNIPFISSKDLKNLLFYLSILISTIFFIYTDNTILNMILGIILLSTGLFYTYKFMFETDYSREKLFFVLFSFSIIFLSPMIVGRYLYIGYFFYMLTVSKYLSSKDLKSSFIITLVLLSFLLYSDLKITNSYRELTFKENGYFIGEWGYRYNAESKGLKPLKINFVSLPDSSSVYISNFERMYNPNKDFIINLRPVRSESLNNFFVKTISKIYGSGYYTDLFGLLPFSFGKDYSTYNNEYLYLKDGNPIFKKYREKVSIIGSEVVITCKLSDTIRVENESFEKIKISFFDDFRVLKKSDGIKIFINYLDGEKEEHIVKPNSSGLISLKNKGVSFINFDKNRNDNFDWFGITFY
uniref:Glycosyltransferase RgtA/B/C/D-like domain-containing protein n=1 Tax=candidate division WOR-3 bacterium TaxID=2052148 RepID=A0A7C3N7A6_UNCW3